MNVRIARIFMAIFALSSLGCSAFGAAPDKKATAVFLTAEEARKVAPDVDFQGEYMGKIEGGEKIAAQVIALGGGAFQAVLLPGGLPGAGWDGKSKIILDGKIEGYKVDLLAANPRVKTYMAAPPANFSAVRDSMAATKDYSATIAEGEITGKTDEGKKFSAKRILRKSPTMGAKPPEGAIVLFDGTNKDAWNDGRLDEARKALCTDEKDIVSKQMFSDYTIHAEFFLPFRPEARSQGRANSGFYQAGRYEVQVLDSFGLEGLDNECGGIYKKATPMVNMCFPPLTWQTYDVEFTNAKVNDMGEKTAFARITVRHNGVLIHDNVEIEDGSLGARAGGVGQPGSIKLQGHGNPLAYRNIWIVEK